MQKVIMKFGDIEMEKQKFQQHKSLFFDKQNRYQ